MGIDNERQVYRLDEEQAAVLGAGFDLEWPLDKSVTFLSKVYEIADQASGKSPEEMARLDQVAQNIRNQIAPWIVKIRSNS